MRHVPNAHLWCLYAHPPSASVLALFAGGAEAPSAAVLALVAGGVDASKVRWAASSVSVPQGPLNDAPRFLPSRGKPASDRRRCTADASPRKNKPDNRGGRLRVMASLDSAPHAATSRDLPGRSGVNRPAACNLQALPSRQSRRTTECHCYEIASPLARPCRAQWSTQCCKRDESTLLVPTRMRVR